MGEGNRILLTKNFTWSHEGDECCLWCVRMCKCLLVWGWKDSDAAMQVWVCLHELEWKVTELEDMINAATGGVDVDQLGLSMCCLKNVLSWTLQWFLATGPLLRKHYISKAKQLKIERTLYIWGPKNICQQNLEHKPLVQGHLRPNVNIIEMVFSVSLSSGFLKQFSC